MALRLAINGLGRISSQLVRVVNEGGFSDLFEIAAIHDAAGPEGIVRALAHDSVYGPFPGELNREGDVLKIGEQTITLSDNVDGKNATWGKTDTPLVIVDGAAVCDAAALDQHLKKGAKRVILPMASSLARINIGIGVNEGNYDLDTHDIVASAAGATSAISIAYQLLDGLAKIRCGNATVLSPATGGRSLVDTPGARGGANALWPVPLLQSGISEQLIGKLSNRLSVSEIATPAQGVGSIALSVWLEQRVTEESLRETFKAAEESDELAGLVASRDGVSASSDILRDSRTLIVDWSQSTLLYETFLSVTGWYDAEWAAACRLADTLAIICEAGVPGTA